MLKLFVYKSSIHHFHVENYSLPTSVTVIARANSDILGSSKKRFGPQFWVSFEFGSN